MKTWEYQIRAGDFVGTLRIGMDPMLCEFFARSQLEISDELARVVRDHHCCDGLAEIVHQRSFEQPETEDSV